jgi:hypothetical protein
LHAFAQEAAPEVPAQQPAAPTVTAPAGDSEPEAPSSQPRSKPSSKKRVKNREKETEGTEAADRFEANTVIKSKYELNGEHLEVDPD